MFDQLTVLETAALVQAAYGYDYENNGGASDPAPLGDIGVKRAITIEGMEALILANDLLILVGTNQVWDWFDYNFDLFPNAGQRKRSIPELAGASGAKYHGGFYEYAKLAYLLGASTQIKAITGHSLGGAAAQILGASWRLPTITFGSPQPLASRNHPIELTPNIVNFCRKDDMVCKMPPLRRYRHIGQTFWMDRDGFDFSFDHPMPEYVDIIAEARVGLVPRLPDGWQIGT